MCIWLKKHPASSLSPTASQHDMYNLIQSAQSTKKNCSHLITLLTITVDCITKNINKIGGSMKLTCRYNTGVTISTHKPRNNKDAPALQPQDANNRKKFAFLSRETTPDYRPLATWQGNQDDTQVHIDINITYIYIHYSLINKATRT